MTSEWALAGLGVAFFGYALVSKRLSMTVVTGPMVFVTAGLLISPRVFDISLLELNSEVVQLLLEGTLVLVLFTDAMAIDYRSIRKEAFIPTRLLGIALPLIIALGTVVAALMFSELGVWEAAIIATILAPTDAALGQAVVSNPRVPRMIRQGLNAESGLNDGIALPFLLVFIAGAEASLTNANVVRVFAAEIFVALAVGVALGWLGAQAVRFFNRRDWMTEGWRGVSVVALALLAYGLATPLGGSGFIAAFIAGLVFGHYVRGEITDVGHFAESLSYLLTMLSFLVFGSLVLAPRLDLINTEMVIYAVLSLTVIRLVPVGLSMIGTSLQWRSVAYLAWFGPRGLASVIFGSTVLLETTLPSREAIVTLMAIAVALSIYAHGATSWPGSNRYADWYDSMSDDHDEMMESMEVEHMGVRRRIHRPGSMTH